MKKIIVICIFLCLSMVAVSPYLFAEEPSTNTPFFLFDWIGKTVDYLSNVQVRSRENSAADEAQTKMAWFLDPPGDIRTEFLDETTNLVSWTPPFIDNQLIGYNVYRRTQDQRNFHKVNTELIEGMEFTDTVQSGVSYEYYVVSVTSDSLESVPSDYLFAVNPDSTRSTASRGFDSDKILRASRTYPEPSFKELDDGDAVIEMGDLITIGQFGEPMLPIDTLRFVIPPDMEVVDIKAENVNRVTFSDDINIAYQSEFRPVSTDEGPLDTASVQIPTINRNLKIYESDNEYPVKIVKKHSIQLLHGYRILIVSIYPVRYFPKSKRADYIQNLDIVVDLKENHSISVSSLKVENFRKRGKDASRVAEEISNPEDMDSYRNIRSFKSFSYRTSGLVNPGESYEYVIICPDAFVDEFQVLADYKISKGTSAKVVKTTEISAEYGWGTEQIRNFVRDAYNQWGTTYLLLGGDTQFIPYKGLYARVGCCYSDSNIPADLFFGCLDGVGTADLYAEVFVGRAPVDNETEVNNFVHKVVSYSNMKSSDPSRKKVVLLAEKLDYRTYGAWSMNRLANVLSPTPMTIIQRDDTRGGWNRYDVANYINSGVNMINHLGHANKTYGWRTYSSYLNLYTNTIYPVIYTQGCLSGAFEYPDCISELMVTNETGASAVLSNSRYGWYYRGGDNGPSQRYHEWFIKRVFEDNVAEIGKANQKSKEAVLQTHYYFYWIYWDMNLMGDPHMKIYNGFVRDLEVSIDQLPGTWISGDVTFTARTDGGEGNLTSVKLQYSSDQTNWVTIEENSSQTLSAAWDTRVFEMSTAVYIRALAQTDQGENATSNIIQVSIDNVKPDTTYTAETGWSSEPVTVYLNESDTGSGIHYTYYTLDGATPNAQSQRYTQPIQLNTTDRYNIRFYSVDQVEQTQDIQTIPEIIVDTDLQSGWPHTTTGAVYGAPTVANIDFDESKEIIFGSQDGKLHVLKANGTPALGWPQTGFTGGASSAAVGDIDGDKDMEIIVGGAYSGVLAFHHDGTPVSGWPVLGGQNKPFGSSPALGDMNHDGVMDVVIGALGKVYVYNAAGELLPGWPQDAGLVGEDMFSSPSVGDIDGDGDLEIAIGSRGTNAKIYLWHHDGSLVQGWPYQTTSDWVASSPVFGNIDDDPDLEIIIGGGSSNQIFALNSDGTLCSGFPFTAPGGHFIATPALADLDGDNKIEIIIGNLDPFSNKLYAICGNGSVLTHFPIALDHKISSAVVVGDIDNDQDLEIIYGSDNNYIYAVHHTGSAVSGFPKQLDGTISLSPTISDVNQNGNIDLVAASWDGRVYVWDLETPYQQDYIPWSMFKHNTYHTGMVPSLKLITPNIDVKHGKNIQFWVDMFTNESAVSSVVYEYSTNSTNGLDGTYIQIGVITAQYPYTFEWNSSLLGNVDENVYFRIYFRDQNGNASSPIIFKLHVDNDPPDLPATVQASDYANDNGNKITISWSKSNDDGTGQNDLVKYYIYRSTSQSDGGEGSLSEDTLIDTVDAGATSYTDDSAQSGVTYYYSIGVDDGTNIAIGDQTGPVTAQDNVPPANITNFQVTDTLNDNGDMLRVSFTASSSDTGDENIVYHILKGPAADQLSSISVSTQTTYMDANCPLFNQYYYQIKTTDGTHEVLSNVVGPVTSVDNNFPATVTDLTMTSDQVIEPNIILNWTLSPDDGANANDVVGYDVYRKLASAPSYTKLTRLAPSTTTYIDNTVGTTSSYYYMVHTVDQQNDTSSDPLGPVFFLYGQSLENVTQLAVTDIAADQGTALQISFTKSASDDGNRAITYHILKGTQPGQLSEIHSFTSTTYQDTQCVLGTAYYYQIKVSDPLYETISETIGPVQTVDNRGPALSGQPSFSSQVIVEPNITVTWTLSSDDGQGADDVTKYAVYRKTPGNTFQLLADVLKGTQTYQDTAVVRGQAYYYRIDVFDATNESVGVSTGPAQYVDQLAPQRVTNVTAQDVPNDQGGVIQVTWSLSSDDGAGADDIQAYRIERVVSHTHTPQSITQVANGQSSYTDSSATFDQGYYYRVIAIDLSQNQSVSNWSALAFGKDNIIPPQPTNVSAQDKANDQGYTIRLSWDLSAHDHTNGDVTAYRIFQSISENYGYSVIKTSPKGTSSVDLSVPNNGQTFYYKIQAQDRSNLSTYTPVVSAAAVDNLAPLSVSNFTVADIPLDQDAILKVSWHISGDDGTGSNDVTGYELFRALNISGPFTKIASLVKGASSYKDTSISLNSMYYYYLTTTDGTNLVTSITQSGKALDQYANAPTEVSVQDVGPDQGGKLNVLWTASVDHDVVNYAIYRNETLIKTVNATTTQYIDTQAGTTAWYYQVVAIDNAGNNGASQIIGPVRSVDNIPPTAPTQFTAQDIPNDQGNGVQLTWVKSISEVTGEVTGYTLLRSLQPEIGFGAIAHVDSGVQTYVDTSTQPLTDYYYKVAVNDIDNSSESTVLGPVQAIDNLAPQAVSSLTAQDKAQDQGFEVTLQFITSPDDGAGANDVTAYTIERSSNGNSNWTAVATLDPFKAASQTAQHTLTIPENQTMYYFRIILSDGTNPSDPSNSTSVKAADNIVNPPTEFNAADITPDQGSKTEITWTASTDNGSKGQYQVSIYQLYRLNPDNQQYALIKTISANDPSRFVDTNLDPSIQYRYRIIAAATDAETQALHQSNAQLSNKVQALDNIKPEKPAVFNVQDIANDNGKRLSLSWSKSPDDGAGANDVQGYVVYRSLSQNTGFVEIKTIDAPTNTYIDNNLNNQRTYYYKIAAKDSINLSNLSTIAFGAPIDEIKPSVVRNFTAIDAPNDQGHCIDLDWNQNSVSAIYVEDISRYELYRSESANGLFEKVAVIDDQKTVYKDINLSNRKSYYYQMASLDGTYSEKSAVIGPIDAVDNVAPQPPTLLIGKDQPNDLGKVAILSWNLSLDDGQGYNDVQYYEIYQDDTLIVTVNAQKQGIAIHVENDNTPYYFKVAAVDTGLNRSAMIQSNAIKTRRNIVQPPTLVLAQDTPNDLGGSIQITWTKSSEDNGAGLVTQYAVTRKTAEESTWTLIQSELPIGTQSYTDDTAELNTNYFYQVLVYDRFGNQGIGMSQAAMGINNLEPNQIADLRIMDSPNDMGTALDISFGSQNPNSSRSDLTYVLEFRSGQNSTFVELLRTSALPASTTHQNLTESESYTYRVNILYANRIRNGVLSDPVQPADNLRPNPIKDLLIADIPADQGTGLKVSFGSENPNINREDLIYELERKANDSESFVYMTRTTSIPFQMDNTGLLKTKTYAYRVNIIYASKTQLGQMSTPVSPQDNIPPQPAQNFFAKDKTDDNGYTIELLWTKSPGDSSIGDVTGYQMTRLDPATNTWTICQTVAANNTTCVDTVSSNNIDYQYKIITLDGTYSTVLPTAVTAKALDNIAPASVTQFAGIDAQNDRGGQVILTWKKSTSDQINGDLTHYELFRRTIDTGFIKVKDLPAGTITYTDTSLTNDVPYSYRIQSSDSTNVDPGVVIENIVAQHNHPQSEPVTGLAVQDQPNDQGSQILIEWTPSVDDGAGYNDVTQYRIYRSIIQNGTLSLMKTTSTGTASYVDTTCTNGQTYWYEVRVFNGYSETVSDRLDAKAVDNIPPQNPAQLQVVDTANDAGGSISISWQKSPDDGANINDVLGYTIYRATSQTAPYQQVTAVPAGTEEYTDDQIQDFTYYYYKIVAKDSDNESSGVVYGPVVAHPDISLSKGLHFVSLPFTPGVSETIAHNLGLDASEFSLYYWESNQDPTIAFHYKRYPEISKFSLGKGFLVDLEKDTKIVAKSGQFAPSENYTIALNKYWNMIGCPFNFAVDLDKVQIKHNNQVLTFDEAIAANLIQSSVWTLSDNGYLESTQLESFKGYWIMAFEPVEMMIPPIASSGYQASGLKSTQVRAQSASNKADFLIQISASAKDFSAVDIDNFIGSVSNAKDDLDGLDTPEPPVLKDYVQLYFKNRDFKAYSGKYAADVRGSIDTLKTWQFNVETDKPKTPIQVRFSGLSTLDPKYAVSLFDATHEKTITIDSSHSKIMVQGATEFRLTIQNTDQTGLTITNVYNYPNPFNPNNSSTKLYYELNKIASGKIDIYSISGIKVRTIEILEGGEGGTAGPNMKEWDGADDMGQVMSNGVYFFYIQLESVDGESAKVKGKAVVWK